MDVRFLALIMALPALAGCIGDGDAEPVAPVPTQTDPTPTASAVPTPTTPPEPGNRAPLVQLSADKSTHVLGEPFTFSLDAEDADGDDLAWFFDADGDGSEEASGGQDDLPKDVEHTYGATGEYNATFTVSDGVESVVASVNVTITKVPFEDFTETFEGAVTGVDAYPVGTLPEDGTATHALEVPAGAGRIEATLTWGEAGIDLDLYMYNPAGNLVARSASGNSPDPVPVTPAGETFTYDPGRILSAGVYTLDVVPYQAVNASYTLTVTVKEDLAPEVRVWSAIAPVAPAEDAFACEVAAALAFSDFDVLGLGGRAYRIDPAEFYVVFSGGDGDAQVLEAAGTVPGGHDTLAVCAAPPAPPGEYTLTIG